MRSRAWGRDCTGLRRGRFKPRHVQYTPLALCYSRSPMLRVAPVAFLLAAALSPIARAPACADAHPRSAQARSEGGGSHRLRRGQDRGVRRRDPSGPQTGRVRSDLILAQATGDRVAHTRRLAQGMSGSPVVRRTASWWARSRQRLVVQQGSAVRRDPDRRDARRAHGARTPDAGWDRRSDRDRAGTRHAGVSRGCAGPIRRAAIDLRRDRKWRDAGAARARTPAARSRWRCVGASLQPDDRAPAPRPSWG